MRAPSKSTSISGTQSKAAKNNHKTAPTPRRDTGCGGQFCFYWSKKGVATAKITYKLKQIQEATAEAKEQVTNGHSVNFRDEVTQIVSDVKVLSATLSKISEACLDLGRAPQTPHIDTAPHPAE